MLTTQKHNITRKECCKMELAACYVANVLKDHKEVNKGLTTTQLRERITNQNYLALNELVNVVLPFKEAMQEIE